MQQQMPEGKVVILLDPAWQTALIEQQQLYVIRLLYTGLLDALREASHELASPTDYPVKGPEDCRKYARKALKMAVSFFASVFSTLPELADGLKKLSEEHQQYHQRNPPPNDSGLSYVRPHGEC